MTVDVKLLREAKQLEAVQTAQYTAANVTAIIDKATVTNTSSANVTLSVNVIEPSGTATAANLIIDGETIPPGETYTCPELVGHAIPDGYTLSTLAGAAASLTMMVSGREIS